MCRKGGMFAPLHTWRRWHRKINQKQKRHAVASALAASAVAPLVLARGHRVQEVPELPLVIDSLNVDTTKTLLATIRKYGANEELKRTRESRKIRQGHGKMRNSRYVLRKGPLIVYGDENNLVKRTARNLPGIETCNVHRLNLLQLAPGGHLGRFIIWTKDAFQALNNIFGKWRSKGIEKSGYVLNRNVMTCADLARIINSDQVQSKIRTVRTSKVLHEARKRNPLKSRSLMKKLNPVDATRREAEAKLQTERNKNRAKVIKEKRKSSAGKKAKAGRTQAFHKLEAGLIDSYQRALEVLQREEALGKQAKEEEEDEE
jgi:large subunit ribosomal protein L4e